jgi:hypothetical protein
MQSHKSNRITSPDSQYHEFEISFGANVLNNVNDFMFSLPESEFDSRSYVKDPLLNVCQKLLDWKCEVGSSRLSKELYFSDPGQTYSKAIKRAWDEVKKEQDIIESARQSYKKQINKYLETNPRLLVEDPARWCALCDGFSEFEALKTFNYPLPFANVF